MYLQDILPKMSKLYLGRIVDSFLKDVHMDSEEEMREVILKNITSVALIYQSICQAFI